MDQYCWREKVLLKDFADYSRQATERIRQEVEAKARRHRLDIHYVPSSTDRQEDITVKWAAQTGRTTGLTALHSAVEPYMTFEVRKDHTLNRLALKVSSAKCLHYYHYWHHPKLGPWHVRLQTWFPFSVFVCVNGREILAQQIRSERIKFRQRDSCFSWVAGTHGYHVTDRGRDLLVVLTKAQATQTPDENRDTPP